jgi:iron complex transport system permease protein
MHTLTNSNWPPPGTSAYGRLLVLFILLCAVVIIALTFGAGTVFPTEWGDASPSATLVLVWRAPRVAAAFVVGACLAVSGLIFQGVFRNPLAEPYLLGSASGASLGAACALLLPEFFPRALSLPALAFIGAWLSSLIVLLLGGTGKNSQTGRLLLAGVALAAILSALRSLILMIFGDEASNLRAVISWQLGGIQTPTWFEFGGLFAMLLLVLIATYRLAPGLDALGLGEEIAHSMGIRVRLFIFQAIALAALCTAMAVAWGGLIGFVGLVVPHVLRKWIGPLHAQLIGASALAGGILLVLVDTAARCAMPPSEIPVGLMTSLIGGPFFLYLLLRKRV